MICWLLFLTHNGLFQEIPKGLSGELTIMVGGEAEQIDRMRDILNVLGTHIIHAGPIGHGEVVKITNNMIVGMLLPALSEALTLAVKAERDWIRYARF